MKVKNNMNHNVCFNGKHVVSAGGKGMPNSILIPAGSILELDDDVWVESFAAVCSDAIKSEALTFIKAPKMTPEQAVEAANKAVKAAKAAKELASELGEQAKLDTVEAKRLAKEAEKGS